MSVLMHSRAVMRDAPLRVCITASLWCSPRIASRIKRASSEEPTCW